MPEAKEIFETIRAKLATDFGEYSDELPQVAFDMAYQNARDELNGDEESNEFYERTVAYIEFGSTWSEHAEVQWYFEDNFPRVYTSRVYY